MTIICAITGGKETWVGADSLANNNDTVMNGIEKWAFSDGWGAASAGCFKTNNLLNDNKENLFDRLSTAKEFVGRLTDLFSDYNTDTDVGPKLFGQNIILVNHKAVWMLDTSLAYVCIPKGYLWADGSGRGFGIGAGNLKNDSRSHKERVKAALYGAIEHDITCGGKMMIRSLTPNQ